MKTIGIMPHVGKPEAVAAARNLGRHLRTRGLEVLLEKHGAELIGHSDWGVDLPELAERSEVVVVVGGDGAILRAARLLLGVPLFGLNCGRLGFLAGIELDEVDRFLPKLLAGEYTIEERSMLQVQIQGINGEKERFIGLNDAVIARGTFARIIRLRTSVGNDLLNIYPADGLVVATPTGSTAYSLAAGGPILQPAMPGLLITPICPHMLGARSVVIGEDEVIRIQVEADHQDVTLAVDGQFVAHIDPEDEVTVCRAPEVTRLVRMEGRSFYQILRSRLSAGKL